MNEALFEYVVAGHLALLLIATSWAFGGNADWVRVPLAALGSVGPVILATAVSLGVIRGGAFRRLIRWLWPLALFNLLVLASCLMPSLRVAVIEATRVLIPQHVSRWLPSAAVPDAALLRLWIFDGTYLSCFNLIPLVHRRRTLRRLFSVVAINGLALAVFGTVQKLCHATGLFFGLVPSPQPYFFSSFVYDNHWGAFALLMTGIALGIAWRHIHAADERGLLQSPAFGAAVMALLIGLSIPLSGSRLCTALLAALAVLTGIRQFRPTPGDGGPRRRALLIGGCLGALAVGGAATWWVAGDVLSARLEKTREQFAEMRAHGDYEFRGQLYRDTVHMASERILFGWGMGSYPTVFMFFNSAEPNSIDHLPIYYHDAHSDWLQAVAENGVVGAALLALCAWVPFRRARLGRKGRPMFSNDPIILCVGTGCALVLAYALIEFPFGNTAVALAWWLCYFAVLRYTRLGDNRVAAADHRTGAK